MPGTREKQQSVGTGTLSPATSWCLDCVPEFLVASLCLSIK